MKLLSPTELRDTRAQQLARDALRNKELAEAADKSRKNLANAEADFQFMLSGQRARWAQEEEAHVKTVESWKVEIDALENRRSRAEEPIDIIRRRAKDTLSDAQNTLRSLRKKENDVEAIKELLEDRLDAVGGREQDVLVREQKIPIQEEAIATQQKLVSDNTAYVNESLKKLAKQKTDTYNELNKRQSELTLLTRSLEAQSDMNKRTEKELANWAKQLKDREGTLEREVIRRTEKKKVE